MRTFLSITVLTLMLAGRPDSGLAQSTSIVVNTTLDVVDFGNRQQISDLPGPDGLVSLAEAVTAANNTPGPDTIRFNIPTTDPNFNYGWLPGVFVLFVESSAPLILRDHGTTIDGHSQTVFTGDTSPGPEIHIRTTPPYANAPGFIVNSDRNTIKGLQGFSVFRYGVQLNGNDNTLQGNVMTQPGSAAVYVTGRRNCIGGLSVGEGNRLSSSGSGVWLAGTNATGNLVQGNVILGNHGDGIAINDEASGNLIGGPGAGNIIFRNGHTDHEGFPTGAGVLIRGDNNVVEGNQIGLNESGAADAGSAWSGVELWGSSNRICGNVISGHAGYYFKLTARPAGVRLAGGTNNLIAGNWIGTDRSRKRAAGNGYGVKAEVWSFSDVPMNDMIGGTNPGAGNIIAYNQYDGIAVGGTAKRIRILGNSIFDNGELGINLDVAPYTQTYPNTVTTNDLGDGDTGANNLQNYPVIVSAAWRGSAIQVEGTLDTPNPQTTRVELFLDDRTDTTGFGEGRLFAVDTTPNAAGQWSAALPAGLSGRFVTATAMDAAGNSSEFGRAAAVTGDGPVAPVILRDSALGVRSNRFGFNIACAEGSVVVVEYTTNLTHWIPLETNTFGVGPLYFSDPVFRSMLPRLYRVKRRP